MGSSDPAQSRKIAPRLAAEGIGWVDAPVSGGPECASKGTLAIMAGGKYN
jgi:2-hydroxy-3-oxopropionate reductase